MTRNSNVSPEDSGSGSRALAAPASCPPREDDSVFPPLRLAPVPGESNIENVLRQIRALMQPLPDAALPPPRPGHPPQPAAATAAMRSDRPAPNRAVTDRSALRLSNALAGVLAGVAVWVVCAVIYAQYAAVELSGIDLSQSADASTLEAAAGAGVGELATPPATPPESVGEQAHKVALVPIPPPAEPVATGTASEAPAAAVSERPALAGQSSDAPQAIAAISSIIPPGAELQPPTPPSVPTSASFPSGASTSPGAATPGFSSASAALLVQRGEQMLAYGDVTSARRFFEQAAMRGDAAAATGMGKTFDPLILERISARGIKSDAAVAAEWYTKAALIGSAEAETRLRRLDSRSR